MKYEKKRRKATLDVRRRRRAGLRSQATDMSRHGLYRSYVRMFVKQMFAR